jgi:hypothetical protein
MISHKYRFNWNSPIALSPLNPKVVYFGGNVLFKSTDYGHSWTPISPDLSTNDPKKQESSGGPIVVDNTAAEFHCTIITIAPSPVDSNVIWVGTDDGNVQVTRDGGKSWSNVFTNVPGLKPNAWIPTVDASHYDAGTAYVAADHHQDDDYSPYAYMTTDYGKTWKRITGDLPNTAAWVHVVREDPKNRNLFYIGTEMGAWASWDKGAHWVSMRGDLPVVQVRDIQVHPRDNDLLLATHGRGLFVMDDISALQGLETAQTSDAVLFDVRPATRWSMWNRDGNLGQKKWTGENPPAGALITYYLKSQPAGEVNLTITDQNNRVVRRMRRVADDAGINRVVWDLRHDTPAGGAGGGRGGRGGGGGAGGASTEGPQGGAAQDTSLAAFRARRAAAAALAESDAQPGAEEGGFGGRGGGGGLDVLPGVYTVSLSVNGKQLTKTVQVNLDPRSDMTPAQLTAQFETATQLNDLAARVNRVVSGVDDLLTQLTSLQAQVRRNATTQPQLLSDIGGTIGELRHFRDSVLARPLAGLGYRQYPRLREEVQTVSGMVSRPMMPPTAGELLRMGELKTEADQAQARLDDIIQNRVSKINQALSGTPHVIVPQRAGPIIP